MNNRPSMALDWAHQTFGPVAWQRGERTMRLAEEAIEAAHAEGSITLPEILRMVARVFDRPRGDYRKELGQVGLTLELAAANVSLDINGATQAEFDRVRSIPKEEWEKRHAAKVAAGFATPR